MTDKDILAALRSGTVPTKGLKNIAVGQDIYLKELKTELEYISTGNTSVRFIKGDYGAGKTFLCTRLAEFALENKFMVAHIVISPSVSLSNFKNIYRAAVNNLQIGKEQKGSAFADVLDQWALKQFERTKKTSKNPKNIDAILENFKEDIEARLVKENNIHPAFASAIKSYAVSMVSRDKEKAKIAFSWLRGVETISSSEYKKALQLKSHSGNQDAYSFLKGLLFLICDVGHKGLLLVIDETEIIQRYQQKQPRQRSYETIRVILDMAGRNELAGCLFLFTGTPSLFENKRFGIPSYDALAQRIIDDSQVKGESKRQPILSLKPLNEKGVITVAYKIRNLHQKVYEWDANTRINDDLIERLSIHFGEKFGSVEANPRKFLKSIIKLFDLVQEFPKTPVEDFIPEFMQDK